MSHEPCTRLELVRDAVAGMEMAILQAVIEFERATGCLMSSIEFERTERGLVIRNTQWDFKQ